MFGDKVLDLYSHHFQSGLHTCVLASLLHPQSNMRWHTVRMISPSLEIYWKQTEWCDKQNVVSLKHFVFMGAADSGLNILHIFLVNVRRLKCQTTFTLERNLPAEERLVHRSNLKHRNGKGGDSRFSFNVFPTLCNSDPSSWKIHHQWDLHFSPLHFATPTHNHRKTKKRQREKLAWILEELPKCLRRVAPAAQFVNTNESILRKMRTTAPRAEILYDPWEQKERHNEISSLLPREKLLGA